MSDKYDAGLADVAEFLGDQRAKLVRNAKALALARNLETLQNAAVLARMIKRERPNKYIVRWCDYMERAATELTDYLVPDQEKTE